MIKVLQSYVFTLSIGVDVKDFLHFLSKTNNSQPKFKSKHVYGA